MRARKSERALQAAAALKGALQAVQESRLKPDAKSPFGAQGIMQIMPRTAKELGVKDPWDPIQSIEGGRVQMRAPNMVELVEYGPFAPIGWRFGVSIALVEE